MRSHAVLVRLLLSLVASMLMATAAKAIDGAYVGIWTRSGGKCEFDEAFRITREGIAGHEYVCTTTRSSRDKNGWSVRLSCSGEGNQYTLDLRWRLLKNGRLRETINGKTGEYVRCASITGSQSEAEVRDTPFGRITPREFARQCVSCFNDAQQMGRSVGGYCPPDCVDIFSNNMVCGNDGRCRLGP
jgi:hypothetical protein